jgi:chromosome partitioning protein
MMRVLIYNQKGGVGKTTTAVNLGAALARSGAGRVVLVDLDPQMHLTASLGLTGAAGWSVADWRAGRAGEPVAAPQSANLSVVLGSPDPAAEDAPAPDPSVFSADWVIYDAAPGWNPEVARIMQGSDIVLSPLEADFLGLNGVSRLMKRMQESAVPWDRLNLLICRYSDRLAVHREVRARLAERFGTKGLMPIVIRNSVRLAEAPGLGQTIYQHAPVSTGAADYAALARHLASLAGLGGPKKKTGAA